MPMTVCANANGNYIVSPWRRFQPECQGAAGTAEYNETGDAHSWFIGFAENEGRRIAVAVVMEGAGSGNGYALPLAKQVFDTYFK